MELQLQHIHDDIIAFCIKCNTEICLFCTQEHQKHIEHLKTQPQFAQYVKQQLENLDEKIHADFIKQIAPRLLHQQTIFDLNLILVDIQKQSQKDEQQLVISNLQSQVNKLQNKIVKLQKLRVFHAIDCYYIIKKLDINKCTVVSDDFRFDYLQNLSFTDQCSRYYINNNIVRIRYHDGSQHAYIIINMNDFTVYALRTGHQIDAPFCFCRDVVICNYHFNKQQQRIKIVGGQIKTVNGNECISCYRSECLNDVKKYPKTIGSRLFIKPNIQQISDNEFINRQEYPTFKLQVIEDKLVVFKQCGFDE